MDGIAWLRGRKKIVIHPRCKNCIIECDRYSWKTDEVTEEITEIPVDDFNHCIDALRYSYYKDIKRKKTSSKSVTNKELKDISTEKLQEMLDSSLDQEDYEEAAKIRDEINRRN